METLSNFSLLRKESRFTALTRFIKPRASPFNDNKANILEKANEKLVLLSPTEM